MDTLTASSVPEMVALRRLSEDFGSIFTSNSNSFSDAKIAIAGGREFAVHRFVLSARSPFFKSLFSGDETRVKLEMKDLAKDFEVSFDALDTVLVYLYSGKVRPLRPEGVCVCVDDECEHIACRPAVDFAVEVLYASFVFEISELVDHYQRHLLDVLDKIAADDILVVLSLANICGTECDGLLSRCIDKIVRSDVDIITLERTLPDHIVKQIVDSRKELGFQGPENTCFPDRHVKRIHRALDSDDLELVKMLLKEGHCNIDDACALHYAVSYCDAKTTTELLDLAIADVNHRNPRGYTVLHIAAMRKDPSIIVSLLTKGAQADALTSDGRKALRISKRLTRASDYYKYTERGEASPNDRLCIEILEEAERRPSLLEEASASLAKLGDDLRMMSSYLESRVALAKLLFPAEAKVAMVIARVHDTSEFALPMVNSTSMAGAKRKTVDLDDVPFKIKDEHLNRIKALYKTVELGKLFFPRCSEVLNGMVDNDLSELVFMPNETPEERQLKKQRYTELKDDITRAFREDKKELNKFIHIPASSSSSSSSTSMRGVRKPNGKVTLKK